MSYSIAVVVKDGTVTIDPSGTTTGETLVDGRYVINGHVPLPGTWNAEHIQATRYLPVNEENIGMIAVIQAAATSYYPAPSAS